MAGKRSNNALTRFATLEEVLSNEFMSINKVLDSITVQYSLPDHTALNRERFPWSNGLLSVPSFYASRMWEYPFAILSGDLRLGLKCLDIGCGMTPFTIYLKQVAKSGIVGLDPDLFASGVKYGCHGVSKEFVERTGLQIEQGGIENIPFPSESFDRVFCLSVIEHLGSDIIRKGATEIARVLRHDGRAVITVDVNLLSELSRPLDIVWDSGLIPFGAIDLRWPFKRFGIFCDNKQPADVFGMTLVKPSDYYVETSYGGARGRRIHGTLAPTLRKPPTSFIVQKRLRSMYQKFPRPVRWLAKKIYRAMRRYYVERDCK